MQKLLLGVDRPLVTQFFTRSVREVLEQPDFADVRIFYNLTRSVPYVANLLADSAMLPIGHGLGEIWKFRTLSEMLDIYVARNDCWENSAEAKSAADQLLLFLSLRNRKQERNLIISALQQKGRALYEVAAQDFPAVAERPELYAMGNNFVPWTEILAAVHVNENLPLFQRA